MVSKIKDLDLKSPQKAQHLVKKEGQLHPSRHPELSEQANLCQSVDQTLALVAHELRNPLAGISAGFQALEVQLGDEQTKLRGLVREHIVHAQRLIGDLLDFRRIQTGQFAFVFEPTSLESVVKIAINACEARISNKRQRLELRMAKGGCTFQADGRRLVQAITNLLDNASKFSPEGGSILVSTAFTDTHIEISVEDSGNGMSHSEIERVATPFSKVSASSRMSPTGFGLGLVVVRAVVAGHRGALDIRAREQSTGSRFCITLPRHYDN